MTWLRIAQFFLFGWMGITTEVFFTAAMAVGHALEAGQPINWQLKGHSYPYMLPIYGSMALLFPIFYKHMGHWRTPVRWLAIVLGIYAVEFTTGLALAAAIGRCPWHYETGWHVMHVIRLDYAPAWLAFAAWVDWLFMQSDALLRRGLSLPKAPYTHKPTRAHQYTRTTKPA